MRYVLILAALAALPVLAQQQDYWVIDGIKVPKSKPRMVDLEMAEFQRAQKAIPPPWPQYFTDYWQKRIETAGQLDSGRIDQTTYTALRKVQDAGFQSSLQEATAKAQADYDAMMSRMQAQQQAQRDAQAQRALGIAAGLLQRPAQPTTQTYNINGRLVTCTTVGTFTNCN